MSNVHALSVVNPYLLHDFRQLQLQLSDIITSFASTDRWW
jgi:hypothetical protein